MSYFAKANTYSNAQTTTTEFVAVITETPDDKGKSYRCFVDCELLKTQNTFAKTDEKLLLYLYKSKNSELLEVGDRIVFKGTFSKIEKSGNPYDFDYREYLSRQGIFRCGYIDSISWKRIEKNTLPRYKMVFFELRAWLNNLLQQNGLDNNELGVASALIIGDKSNIDKNIIQAYTSSGTMHLLAVSGMHVILLYWILNSLLSFKSRNKGLLLLKALLLFGTIWFYAALTGLSASVVRAAWMCSFIIVGEAINRKGSIFNSFAFSAFVLLVFNPYYLYDVGFQLSYLAVLSIVVFHPIIFNWFEPRTWLLSKIWEITAVTIAAQVLTTPITMYYFHQFPNLFILSNLVMIPLSTFIIYTTIVLIMVSWWSVVALWLGKIIFWMIWFLNFFVIHIGQIPFSVTTGIYLLPIEVFTIYSFIVTISLYFIYRKGFFVIATLIFVLLFVSIGLVNDFRNSRKTEMVVYNLRNNSLIQFRNGAESIWLAGKYDAIVDKYIGIARDADGCKINSVYVIDSIQHKSKEKGVFLNEFTWIKGNYLQFQSKRIIISNSIKGTNWNNIDMCILRNMKYMIKDTFVIKSTIIVDGSVSKYYIDELQKQKNITILDSRKIGAIKI